MTFYTDDWGLASVAFRRQQGSSVQQTMLIHMGNASRNYVPSISLRTFLTAILRLLT